MDKNTLEREIHWYTDEIRINERSLEEGKRNMEKLERDLQEAKRTVPELERKLEDNKRKLQEYQRQMEQTAAKDKRN